MLTFEAAMLWCALQATLVAGLGSVATWLLIRRAPGSAAIAATGATLTVLGMTLLVPVPLPAMSLGGHEDSESLVRSPEASGGESEKQDLEKAIPGIDLAAVLETVRRTVGGGAVQPEVARAKEVGWASVLLAIGAVVGVTRLGASWRYVARLRESAITISDPRLATLFATLARQLGVRRAVEVAETPLLASPAIVGWRRPLVLLPAGWNAWSHEELQAAMAHELAHAARGDFGWRTLAGVVQAAHAINPLMHVLVRRLALAQELAADRLAATAMGGTGNYLRAMSALALRLDDDRRHGPDTLREWRLRAESLVLPNFSSFLMRRIAMLRSTDGSMAGAERRAIGLVAATLIAVVGVGTVVVRGGAEPAGPIRDESGSAVELFSRSPLEASAAFQGKQGLCVVRFHDLAQLPAFAPVIQLGNSLINEQWQAAFGSQGAPTLRLEAVQRAVGTIKSTWSSTVDADGEKHESHTVECEGFVIQFVDDVEWRPWINKYVPGAEEVHVDGFEYVKLPKLPGSSDVQGFVASRDAKTLVFSSNLEQLRKLAAGAGDDGNSRSTPLASVDGGLIALAADAAGLGLDARLNDATFTTEDAAAIAAVRTIALDVRQIGIGFDLDESSNESEMRFRLGCSDQASAERIRAALVTLRPHFEPHLKAAATNSTLITTSDDGNGAGMVRTAGGDDTDQQCAAWYLALMESAEVRLEPRVDGMVDVWIDCRAPFPRTILTAYQRAEDADSIPVK
jgi:hypothetical protein